MRTIRTVSELRAQLRPPRRSGRRIGLVPTMGAFHGGHLSLIRRARAETDVVVVSLFVNPTQFAAGEDVRAYPRDEARDVALAAELGADILFAPSHDEVYPEGFATTVTVDGVTQVLEGAHRGAAHFRGVTTVVTKLLNMVSPDAAYFGQKDAQQAVVIRRLVADLDIGVDIVVCPTVREPDGLAMSSRNAYLDPGDRARAVALWRGLKAAEATVDEGEREPGALVSAARAAMAEHDVDPEYLEIIDPDTLSPLAEVDGDALIVVAAKIGPARLIDNIAVRASVAPAGQRGDRIGAAEAPCSA
ncbi:MAG: pantoate--beta-alanine ligase [Actinomycetota bacterium]|nr:pantoate--beta-alanine ligase [Actinomycetota bacterium]